MVVHVGRRDEGNAVPKGFLPVFAVGSEAESVALTELARERGVMSYTMHEGYVGVANMLAEEQTLDRLRAFGWELKDLHDEVLVPNGACDCDPDWWDRWVAALPDDEDDENNEEDDEAL